MPVTIANIPGTEVLSISRPKLNTNFANLKTAVEAIQPRLLQADLSFASTVATDASVAAVFDLSLTGNITLANPTNGIDGIILKWRIRQDNTGGRLVTLGNKFRIPSSASSPLVFGTGATGKDILAAMYDATDDKWDVVSFLPI